MRKGFGVAVSGHFKVGATRNELLIDRQFDKIRGQNDIRGTLDCLLPSCLANRFSGCTNILDRSQNRHDSSSAHNSFFAVGILQRLE